MILISVYKYNNLKNTKEMERTCRSSDKPVDASNIEYLMRDTGNFKIRGLKLNGTSILSQIGYHGEVSNIHN